MVNFKITYSILILFAIEGICNALYAQSCISGNCQNGVGTYVLANGDKYDGTFSNGYRNGRGIYWWATGIKYEGDWAYNQMEGFGKITFADGTKFLGIIRQGHAGDTGIYYKADGTVDNLRGFGRYNTIGCYNGNCQDGFGMYIFDNGKYIGDFKDGKRNGNGKYFWNSGEFYNGDW